MPLEVWGAYSVLDHTRPKAFIADVLLYDRLVIPIPPDHEIDEWHRLGWKPDRLKATLKILGDDLVRPVVWNANRRRAFEAAFQEEKDIAAQAWKRAGARFNAAYGVGMDVETIRCAKTAGPIVDPQYVTRMVLMDDTSSVRDQAFLEKHPDVYVEPVAAYPSLARFSEEVPTNVIDSAVAGRKAAANDELAGIFSWEFFLPDDSDQTEEALLAAAVDLAREKRFREARAEFHEWRREIVQHGGTVETMRADMERRISRYREETAKVRMKTIATTGFTVVSGVTSLVAAFLFPPIGIAGGAITLASLGTNFMKANGPSAYARPAAMFADARDSFR